MLRAFAPNGNEITGTKDMVLVRGPDPGKHIQAHARTAASISTMPAKRKSTGMASAPQRTPQANASFSTKPAGNGRESDHPHRLRGRIAGAPANTSTAMAGAHGAVGVEP